MRRIKTGAALVAGSLLLALVMAGLLMAPGFLSGRDSTVARPGSQEARR